VEGLIARDYEVLAATPHDEHSRMLEGIGCKHIPVPLDSHGTSPLRDLNLMVRYLSIFLRERPDVFLGFTIKPNIYGSLAAQSLGIPVINNIAGLGTTFIRDTWLTRVAAWLYRLALARSRTVFFQNPDDLDLFARERLVCRERTRLLPGSGVNTTSFQPLPERSEGKDFRFLLVGRLLYDKGVHEFQQAAREIRVQMNHTRFQLLGPIDPNNPMAVRTDELERWVADGDIEYLGVFDDVRPYIGASDCVVLPSYREGTPKSLLEAAAMGKPLIATDVPGCRQVVMDGENGLLCKPRDARDLACRMREMACLSAEARARMGAAGRAKIEQEFDEEIVVARYVAAIEDALDADGLES